MEQEKKQMDVVHERDVDRLLDKMGIKEDFYNNKKTCKFCKNVVNIKNIYSFLPEAGTINIICDNPKCITDFLEYMESKQKKIIEK